MNRTDRILLEDHVRQLDVMMRNITDMRSVLTRRIRRLETAPIAPVATAVRRRRATRDDVPEITPVIAQVVTPIVTQDVQVLPVVRHTQNDINWLARTGLPNIAGLPNVTGLPPVPLPPVPLPRDPLIAISRHKDFKIINKTITLKNADLEIKLPEACGICLDVHLKLDSVTCDCNHSFGTTCFNEWKNVCMRNYKITNCPTCRSNIKNITTYRKRAVGGPRAPRRKKNQMNPIINEPTTHQDNDEDDVIFVGQDLGPNHEEERQYYQDSDSDDE